MQSHDPTLFQAALSETIAQIGPSENDYQASLEAIADDIGAMTRGWARGELPARTWLHLPWTHFHDGIDRISLACPGGGDATAALLRYRPGASVPYHLHVGNEHIVVLSGSQQDGRGRYRRGTMMFNPAGSAHRVVSPDGCVVANFWERPVRFLAGGPPNR